MLFKHDLVPIHAEPLYRLADNPEAGVPTVRNKLGGHGQGAEQIEVPDYVAAYALHLTATNILLLVNAEEFALIGPTRIKKHLPTL